jgi:7-cyano-7-deazaguanine synthase
MSKKRRAVVCLSGGMDSTSLLLRLVAEGRQVYGLSFDYGQKHRIELSRLKKNLTYLRANGIEIDCQTLDMSKLGSLFHSALTDSNWTVPTGHYQQENMKQTVVPNRNAIFSSVAYGYALSIAMQEDAEVDFSLGVHSGDHAIYPDCRPEFYEAIFRAFTIGNWDSETIFRNTCTSYQPDKDGKSHGLTGSDVERILAFHQFGRPDPVPYRDSWEEVVKQALKLERQYQQDSSVGL